MTSSWIVDLFSSFSLELHQSIMISHSPPPPPIHPPLNIGKLPVSPHPSARHNFSSFKGKILTHLAGFFKFKNTPRSKTYPTPTPFRSIPSQGPMIRFERVRRENFWLACVKKVGKKHFSMAGGGDY